MAKKSNNTPLLIGVAVVAIAGIGGFMFMQSKKDPATMQLPDNSAEAEANARIAEAEARKREAELAADIRKRELEAANKPIGDRILDGLISIGGNLAGSIKF